MSLSLAGKTNNTKNGTTVVQRKLKKSNFSRDVVNAASGHGANGVKKNDGMERSKQILSEARSEAERKFDLFSGMKSFFSQIGSQPVIFYSPIDYLSMALMNSLRSVASFLSKKKEGGTWDISNSDKVT